MVALERLACYGTRSQRLAIPVAYRAANPWCDFKRLATAMPFVENRYSYKTGQAAAELKRISVSLTLSVRRLEGMNAPMHILLVEDHDDARRALATLLGFSGHTVIQAKNGADALSAMEGKTVDCAVIDLGQPDISGLDLLSQLLTRGPLKAIALTGNTSPADIAECREAGFLIHLPKPVTIEDLEEALKQLSHHS